ncbi:MAG: HAD hydrolase family protein [Alkaliphilus sp.]|nr:HAD hydrolase family protein [Alkaliphilus sp.]
MLFASDLDQTLIYSRRFLYEGVYNDVKPVEKKKNEYISFMTNASVEKLQQLVKKVLFIPVTTRTMEQYNRIFYIAQEIRPRYAIVSNGAHVLIDGIIDRQWEDKIQRLLKEKCLDISEILHRFDNLKSEEWVLEHRKPDDLFSCCIVDRTKIPVAELSVFEAWLGENNWALSLQGRKLYFVPKRICKGAAIEYIKKKEGCSLVIAAGDSLLDLPMLSMADYALCPSHGELKKSIFEGLKVNKDIEFTKTEGIYAAEEILERVNEIISKRSYRG